jgi:acyl carrier protein
MTIKASDIRTYITQSGVDNSSIEPETALFSSGLLDSFLMVELILFIEEKANISIDASDITLENLDSISAIISFCEKS